jgi:hypothetical protein
MQVIVENRRIDILGDNEDLRRVLDQKWNWYLLTCRHVC